MKTIFLVLSIVITGNIFSSAQEVAREKVTTPLSVNITCQNCVNKITNELAQKRGVRNLEFNIEKQIVTVTFRPDRVSKEQISKAIQDLGYEVSGTVVKEN